MAQLQDAFAGALRQLLELESWGPRRASVPNNRVYYGPDRQRDWIEPDVWLRLDALPQRPSLIVEIDTTPSDLGHNVAKYLWWTGRGHPPIWGTHPPSS